MAVPDSLTAWREFVDRQAVEPQRLTMKQINALSQAIRPTTTKAGSTG